MVSSGVLLAEDKSRHTVLVIEDNSEFGANARVALRSNKTMLATTLEDALTVIQGTNIDYILSDTHFPTKSGEQPKENVREVLLAAAEKRIPVCFVAQTDPNDLVEGDRDHISVYAFNVSKIITALMETNGLSEENLLKNVESSAYKIVKQEGKTAKAWGKAYQILSNVCTKRGSVARAIIRRLGIGVPAKSGQPKVALPKR